MKVIAHLSDLHFGRIDPAVVHGLLVELVVAPPDLVVISGDLVQRAQRRHFLAARAFLEQLPVPYLVVPGNHDLPVYNLLARFTHPWRNYTRYISRDFSPFHVDEEMAVLGLNTARKFILDFTRGRINQAQIARIHEVFDPLPPRLFRIVFTHHPFIPPADHPDAPLVGRAQKALPVLEACGVDLMLAGHLHRAYTGDLQHHYVRSLRSILVAQASTATSTRTRAEPNAYNRITLAQGTVRIAVRAWDGGSFATVADTGFVRDDGRWRVQPVTATPVAPSAR